MNNLIFEELSISNDVLKKSDELRELIKDYVEKDEGRIIRTPNSSILLRQATINLDEDVFGIINTIVVQVVYFNNKNEYKDFFGIFPLGGELHADTKEMVLNLFGIDGIINEKFLLSTLSHELKHCYQISLYNNSNDIPKMYQIASYYLNLGYAPLYIMELSRLIYFFDKNEINANMESLYQELIHSDGELKRINVLNDYEKGIEDYNNLKDYLYDEKALQEIEKLFHKSLKQLLKYIENRIEYFNIRKRKVFAKYKQENKIHETIKTQFNRNIFLL